MHVLEGAIEASKCPTANKCMCASLPVIAFPLTDSYLDWTFVLEGREYSIWSGACMFLTGYD